MALILAAAPAHAQLDRLFQWNKSGLSDAKIADGLKQALQVGAQNAVSVTGTLDGYFANQAIKILMPERLKAVEQGMRTIGQGERVDAFVLGMNRAAERAAPKAKAIFGDAIGAMSFEDARKILQGSNTAATEYFRNKTTGKLTGAFRPVISTALNEVGVAKQYKDLVKTASSVPFVNISSFDLDDYVVGRALGGLFHVVGEEEQKIRANPAARVTPLLKEVFGK
jgi:hypothetical protein